MLALFGITTATLESARIAQAQELLKAGHCLLVSPVELEMQLTFMIEASVIRRAWNFVLPRLRDHVNG